MKVVIVKNCSFMCVRNSIEEAIATIASWYKNIKWQEKVEEIEIRNHVVEPNGYEHTGDEVLYKCLSSNFWY